MIRIEDCNGNIVAEVHDLRFPLKFDAETVYGKKRYKVNVSYTQDQEKIKGFHLTLDHPLEKNS